MPTYTFTRAPREEFETSVKILERIKGGEEAFVTTLIVQEVVDWLEYNGLRNAVPTFLKALNSYVTLDKVECTCSDMLRALDHMQRYNISFIDTTSLAVLERLNAREVYSNDKDFDRVDWLRREFK